ncbi:MAG: VCBS repeat-containing protein [bacterium]
MGRVGCTLSLVGLALCLCAAAAPADLQPRLRFAAAAPLALPVGDDAGGQAIALAHVNEDGVPDLVAIDRFDDALNVQLGRGDGSFAAATLIELDGTPAAVVVVADVASPFGSDFFGDIDGHVDLVVAHDDGDGEIVLGRGDGTFDPPEQDLSDVLYGLELNAVAVRDLDGNGRLDLIFFDAFDAVFFLCNEVGTFAPCATETVETQGAGAAGFTIGDWSGDGIDDVAVVNRDSADVTIIRGLGGGRFSDVPSINLRLIQDPSIDITSVAVGRLNGDDIDDLLIGTAALSPPPSRGDALIAVTPTGPSASALFYYPGPTEIDALSLGDFDADGSVDALLSGPAGLELRRGAEGLVQASQPQGSEAVLPARTIAVADLNGDARPDFVALEAEDGNS